VNDPAELPLDVVAPEVVPGVRVLPILHERLDMAPLVRATAQMLQPRAVAVELPHTLEQAVQGAIKRLPRITAVLSEEPGEDALVWIATPGDPLVEALRWAHEHERATLLIDPDVRYRHHHHEALPDPHLLWQLGPERYLDLIRDVLARGRAEAPVPTDLLREKGMAYFLHQALGELGGPLLAVVGAAHAASLAEQLRQPTAQPLARSRRAAVTVRHLHPSSLTALLHDPPLAHAVYERLRQTGGTLDPHRAPPQLRPAINARVELAAAGLRLITGESRDMSAERRRALLDYAAFHASRQGPAGVGVVDRARLGAVVWEVAAASFAEQTREDVQPWQERIFFDFARRNARLQGHLVPGLFEWVVAGRGVADDNLAWELFDCARTYPDQEEQAEIETARIDGDMLDLGTRKVRFRRRFFRVKQRPMPVRLRQRPEPGDATEWLRAFDGEGICSYPPEDIVIEDYGRFLQAKAISIVAAESAHSEPFSTSMLDGVDIRETLHRWHEGRVWVRELGREPGAAGSVVVIFDEDPDGTGYPYLMSWLGEHDQESDMALYASDPVSQIVGPGIMRATYGGFLLISPPGRLYDVWRDPDYRRARSKSEVLLMAAIDYSEDKHVVHVAAAAPSPRLKAYAARMRKRVVHIPLGGLSPVTLRKLRVVHILAGRDKRGIAPDYIW